MLPQYVNEGMYILLGANISLPGNSVCFSFTSSEWQGIFWNSHQSFNKNILTHLCLKSKTSSHTQSAITLSKVKPIWKFA